MKKQNNIFEHVQVGDIIEFNNKGFVESALVASVKERVFTATALKCFDKNGIKSFYDAYFTFFKSGKKANKNYIYGDAIKISCKFK